MQQWKKKTIHVLFTVSHTTFGDNMQNSKDFLNSILKTAQMGQVGIRSVLDTSMRPSLRKALEGQLREFDSIETEAHQIAFQRGWEIRDLEPALRFLTDRKARMKLTGKNTDSRIADMMIQGSTRGMIREIKNRHQFPESDGPVTTLSQKLIDCETACIRQMQNYL